MTLSWLQIVRLGLVQMCLGAIVVLTTSTLNRLMVVELALPAVLSGTLVALHYGIQITRPSWGFLSDTGGRRTHFVIGGMIALAVGGLGAATGIWLLEQSLGAGLALSFLSYLLIGLGVGAAGTALLALLATATAPERRGAAATITWLMMIVGIVITTATVGVLLQPYSPALLLRIVSVVTLGAVVLTALAVWGIEARVVARREPEEVPFWDAFREVWADRRARSFTIFVFLSMTAYFTQDPILEPYAGMVFGMSPGQTTSLASVQHIGVLAGMVLVGVSTSILRVGSLRAWVVTGCLGSAVALAAVAGLGNFAAHLPLAPAVVAMGFFNGMFAVAAIGSMMALAGEGGEAREGTRMGLWGAAQAIAAGLGFIFGASLSDLGRMVIDTAPAFGAVFLTEAILFLLSAWMALRIMESNRPTTENAGVVPGE